MSYPAGSAASAPIAAVGGQDEPEAAGPLKKLFEQVELGSEAQVVEIIDRDFGGNTNVADEGGVTALIRAVVDGKTPLVQALMDKRADIMLADTEGDNPLMFAISQDRDDIVRKFLSAGADVDVPNKIGQTPLMKAVGRENIDTVRLLLEGKANPNATTRYGKTALAQAVEKNNADIADALLKSGSDPCIDDSMGLTPLFPAAFRCNESMLKLLLDARADVKAKARPGTSLMMAVDSASFKLGALQLLIDSGCPLDAQNGAGDTALILAAERNMEPAVKALVQAKADLNIKNKEGKAALDVAQEAKNAAVELLLSS